MARPVDIVADLTLTVRGEDIAVRGEDGQRVVVELPSLQAGRALLNDPPWPSTGRRQRINQAHRFLRASGLTVDVRLAGETVARVGAEARPNASARLLNLGDIEVRPSQAAQSAARQRPGLAVGLTALIAALVAILWFWRSED